MSNRKSIVELLNRRKKQILVHSIVYYKMNDNLILDSTQSVWAAKLEELQAECPEIAVKVPYARESKDLDHSTDMSLPLNGPWVINKAWQLIVLKNKGTYGQYEQLKIPI